MLSQYQGQWIPWIHAWQFHPWWFFSSKMNYSYEVLASIWSFSCSLTFFFHFPSRKKKTILKLTFFQQQLVSLFEVLASMHSADCWLFLTFRHQKKNRVVSVLHDVRIPVPLFVLSWCLRIIISHSLTICFLLRNLTFSVPAWNSGAPVLFLLRKSRSTG